MKITKTCNLFSILLIMITFAMPLVAAESSANKEPDISRIKVIQNIRNDGATLYYLGQQLGLHGWFITKDKQVQVIYATPDLKGVMVGALMSADGDSLTQQQIIDLIAKNPDLQKKLAGSSFGVMPQQQQANNNSEQQNTVNVQKPADSTPSAAEKLYTQLKQSAHVTFGDAKAPEILMVMDVACPHCHRAWKSLEPLVNEGKISLIMIPMNALGAQSEVEAANWLGKKDPIDAWKKHVAGDDKILKIGTPDKEREAAIFNNTELVKSYPSINKTPYIMYRSKDGKIRSMLGEPKDVAALYSDMQK